MSGKLGATSGSATAALRSASNSNERKNSRKVPANRLSNGEPYRVGKESEKSLEASRFVDRTMGLSPARSTTMML